MKGEGCVCSGYLESYQKRVGLNRNVTVIDLYVTVEGQAPCKGGVGLRGAFKGVPCGLRSSLVKDSYTLSVFYEDGLAVGNSTKVSRSWRIRPLSTIERLNCFGTSNFLTVAVPKGG
ncbi:hypothetical protein CK203_067512 [Vitis vinifera]|uniref:Uncharacterized protein n=1 Tax=Vitis vinifera TaxID=29760 RepID=A0A438EBW9_VITVI|nr:hypothetical protein CK203_067512 [Vitis vinifera]